LLWLEVRQGLTEGQLPLVNGCLILAENRRLLGGRAGHGRDGLLRQALASAEPERYRLPQSRPAPVLGPYRARADELLTESESVPRKQRYTWCKVYELLWEEGYRGSGSNLR
jgi:hypothetical protein